MLNCPCLSTSCSVFQNMMKKILPVVCFFLSLTFRAQLFSFNPGEHHYAELSLENSTVLFTYITNLTADSVVMEWRKIEDTLPEAGLPGDGWFTEMCDPGSCYIDLPNNGVMPGPIAPGEEGFVKLILNPQGQEGSGLVHYWVYPAGQMELHEDFYFHVWTPGTVGIAEQNTESISVYPNPASSVLNIQTHEMGLCKIFSADGKEVRSIHIANPGYTITEVGGLPEGLYLVMLNDGVTKMEIAREQ